MNQGTRFTKRCLALLMAAILVASNFSGLAQFVRAEGNDSTTVSIGEIVANNYDLTEAEKNLLSSGLLAGGTFEYTVPTDSDGLVTVDTESKTITATGKDGWAAAVAKIVVNGNVEETVTLTDGEGTYSFAGNAFSVKVTYVLETDVDAKLQKLLLGAPTALKAGLNNMKATYDGTDANLGAIVAAMDVMKQLADGMSVVMGSGSFTLQLSPEAGAAVYALNAQVVANGGELDLQQWHTAYAVADSKVKFLAEHGAEYKNAIVNTYEKLASIYGDPLLSGATAGIVDMQLQINDPSNYTLWNAMKSILKNTVNTLASAANGDWSVLDNNPLAAGLNDLQYAQLDTLVAALGETTAMPEIKDTLKVAETTLTVNMAMYNVTVVVKLNTVNGLAGSKSVVLTLAENATATEILAAVEESGIESQAIAAWGDAYVAGKFEAEATMLPDTLTEDITYIITYSPKNYAVTFEYEGTTKTLPYGTKVTLPKHADPAQAYDYEVNGVAYAQGSTYVVVEDATITREAGKSYTNYDLYSIVADNYGNDIVKDILKSGALKDNVIISVRKPDPADSESLVTLVDGKLTAVATYDSDYEGLSWIPYSYGENGTENLFNGVYTVDWAGYNVKVQYRLVLTNFSATRVKNILDSAVALKAEAAAQKSTLDRLAGYYSTMGQLDKTRLGALNGVIDVTDFTPGDGTDTDAKNLELRAYFKSMVGGIIANNLDSNNYLKIYNILGEYKDETDGGLTYYYKNSANVINEINVLSGYLSGLLADDEKVAALEIMVGAAGFPEYAEKIMNLESVMSEVKAALAAPNALIDLTSANLYKLIAALEEAGEASYNAPASPYLTSENLTALDDSKVMAQVKVDVNGVVATFTTAEFDRGTILTQGAVDALISQVEAFAAAQLGDKIAFYTIEGMDELRALVGTELNAKLTTAYVNYVATEYTVKVEGVAEDIIVDINNVTITLPAHPVAGFVYHYNVYGTIVTVGQEAKVLQLDLSKIENGELNITRTEFNQSAADTTATLEKFRDELNANIRPGAAALIKTGDVYTGLTLNIGAADMEAFIMTMVNFSGYTYYGLNGEGLLYMNDELTLEISIQTLINAMMNDNGFGSDRLIALGENGKGTLLETTLQLGDSADVLDADLDFVITMNSVPSQMGTVAELLSKLNPYLSFSANNGAMDIEMNLPDKVYGAYLAALLTTGYADKNDMNAVDQKIAFMFLCDYLDAFIESGADLVTLENTIAMLGKEINLSKYNKYFTAALEYLTYSADENGLNVNITVPGKSVVDKLLSVLGVGNEQIDTYLGMIKEYKTNGQIEVNAHGLLKNTGKNYNALILDAQASGISNKFACTTAANINSVAANLAGASVIILLDDVDGDLHIAGKTILDLNGKNVSGNIYADGTLYIMDSNMDTYAAGTVGSVSGNATVVAGNYGELDASHLKDGYYLDGTTVRNALYHIEADENGNVTFVINTDVIEDENVDGYLPDVRALALDMVSDLILNYFTTAAMTVDGNEVYDVAFDDLIALLVSSSKADDIIAKVLNSVDASGISGLANTIIADLLDFEAIYVALNGDGVVATYSMTVAPWLLGIGVHEDNYLDVSILSNGAKEESFNVSLKLEGDNIGYIKNLVKELAGIVEDDTNVEIEIIQPTYSDKEFNILVNGEAFVNVDMSANTDYAKILGVILAYGNASKRAAVAEAINNNDMAALKAIVDDTTVAELFTALKAMGRNVNFATMASQVGVTVDVSTAATLEHVYHLSLCAVGKALEKLDITGMNSKFGALYNEDTGLYVLTGDKIFSGELNFRSYTALYKLNANDVTIQLKLFGDTEHVHDYEAVVTAPTCTEQGYTTYTCECGDSYVADYVDALGHSYGEWITPDLENVPCGGTYTETRHCTACDHYETREMVKEIVWGDVNHDGKVNSRDAALILQYCVGKPIEGEFCLVGADVNNDGKVNSRDAALILQYCVGKDIAFPVEDNKSEEA